MKIRKWCKCREPIMCAFGPITCLTCGEIVFKNAKLISKEFRKLE